MEKLKNSGYEKQINDLWEISMLKSQKPFINDIKRQINTLLAAVQVKQLNQDINEYKLKLNKDTSTDEDYQRYLALTAERNQLLAEYNLD